MMQIPVRIAFFHYPVLTSSSLPAYRLSNIYTYNKTGRLTLLSRPFKIKMRNDPFKVRLSIELETGKNKANSSQEYLQSLILYES